MKKFLLGIVFLIVGFPALQAGLLDFTHEAPPELFLEPLALRKKDLKKRASFSKEFKKRSLEAQSSVIQRLSGVNTTIIELENALRNLDEKEKDHVSKKIAKHNERKQILINIQESWVKAEEIVQNHIKLLSEIIEELKTKPVPIEQKLVYGLSDERALRAKIVEFSDKISSERLKYDGLIKQKRAEEELIVQLQKDIEGHKKEQEKILEKIQAEDDEQQQHVLKEEAELLEITSHILEESKEFSEIVQELADVEIAHKKDDKALLEMRLEVFKKSYSTVEARLYIDKDDVTAASAELEKEKQRALEVKNRLNRLRSQKKIERERLKIQQGILDKRVKQFKASGEIDKPHGHVALATQTKISNMALALDRELEVLAMKRELEGEKVDLKSLQVRIVDVRYRIQTKDFEKSDLDKWLADFSKHLKREDSEIRSLEENRTIISNRLTETRRASEAIQQQLNDIKDQKTTTFRLDLNSFGEVITLLSDARAFLDREMNLSQEVFLSSSELIRYKNDKIKHYKMIASELETRRYFDIWRRSPRAIPLEGFWQSLLDAEGFLREFVWRLPNKLSPFLLFKILGQYNLYDVIGVLLLVTLFMLFFVLGRLLLGILGTVLFTICERYKKTALSIVCRIAYLIVSVIRRSYTLLSIWLFVQVDIVINIKHYFGRFGEFTSYVDCSYIIACFYIFSIPVLLAVAGRLIRAFGDLNRDLDFSIFIEELQEHYVTLLTIALYSSIVLVQLRHAFLMLFKGRSYFPTVVFAGYALILQLTAIFLLLIHKDDILKLFIFKERFFIWIKEVIERNYRPVITFLAVLLVLSNPYIGYSNLAFLLLYAAPVTIFLVYGLFSAHSFLRKYSAIWFIAEEDGEIIDRFEHAKAYYGIFVTLTFLFLVFIAFMVVARLWGAPSSLEVITDVLQRQWTIPIGDENRFGVIEFVVLIFFIMGGFVISTLADKFVLNKVFDVLQLDFGVRNTASSIAHYFIVVFSIMLGFAAIKLGSLMLWASGGLLIAIGFGAKDLISDLIAGFLVLLERPIEIGNFIQVGGIVNEQNSGILGTVHKISARSTTLRTARNYLVIIPNKDLITKTIINWGYGRAAVGFEMTLLVEYGSEVEVVFTILNDAVSADTRILRAPAPVYRLESFDDNGLKFLFRAFISARRVRDQWNIASDLRQAILKALNERNIGIPYPQRVIHFKDGKKEALAAREPVSIKFDSDS